MRGMILSGMLLAAMGCASVGSVGVNTSGLVSLASDCGVSVRPPDPAKIPTAHPVAVGASSYLIDPAEVPPSMVVLFKYKINYSRRELENEIMIMEKTSFNRIQIPDGPNYILKFRSRNMNTFTIVGGLKFDFVEFLRNELNEEEEITIQRLESRVGTRQALKPIVLSLKSLIKRKGGHSHWAHKESMNVGIEIE